MLSALKTVHEMLRDRGYVIKKGYEWLDDSKQMIARCKKDELVVEAERKQPQDHVYVFFATEPKVKVARSRLYKPRMDKAHVNHMILVFAQLVTPKAKVELSEFDVEYFKAAELYRNKYYHALVPKHEALSGEEAAQLLKDKNLPSVEYLPRFRSDSEWPIRYHYWPKGTVVRIYRKFGNQQEPKLYYRVVG